MLTIVHRLTVSFGEAEFEGLQDLARRADRSQAWVVRHAVRELLRRVEAGQLELSLLGSEPRERVGAESG